MVQCMMTRRFFSGANTARKIERNTVALTMWPSLLGGNNRRCINRATLNPKEKIGGDQFDSLDFRQGTRPALFFAGTSGLNVRPLPPPPLDTTATTRRCKTSEQDKPCAKAMTADTAALADSRALI
jgi:hypothetical protein